MPSQQTVREKPVVEDALTLAATTSAPGIARDLVEHKLSAWGYARAVDEAQLIVSELATNAVVATKDEAAVIRIYMALMSETIILGVIDHAEGSPQLAEQVDETDISGRGLHILAALSLRWGYDQLRPIERGKMVWAELAL
jgi:anti-sigma regulatory factor (Ser/Thr protein kinase)